MSSELREPNIMLTISKNMPNPTRFPSALRRSDGSDIDLDTPRRREPSAAKLAMMTADQLKAYYQRRGEWQEADKESISKLSNPATFDRGNP
jgi:hypothetical protein